MRLPKPVDLDVEEVMRIAIENNITFYDSSYIALAQKLKATCLVRIEISYRRPRYGVKIIRLHEINGSDKNLWLRALHSGYRIVCCKLTASGFRAQFYTGPLSRVGE